MKIELNSLVTDDEYREAINYWAGNEYERAINSFKDYLIEKRIIDPGTREIRKEFQRYDILKDKKIDFNYNNTWSVQESPLQITANTPYMVYTQLVFHFNDENISLNLNEADIEKFLNNYFFEPFLITKDVYLKFNSGQTDDIKIQFEISPSYQNIYKFNEPLSRNIIHFFEIIRNLHIISLKNRFNFQTNAGGVASNSYNPFDDACFDLADDFSTLNFYKTDESREDYFLDGSQYISGLVYQNYLIDNIHNQTITLSPAILKIFNLFDNSTELDVNELITSNFLNLEIPQGILDRHKQEFDEIYNLVRTIYRNGTVFKTSKSGKIIKESLDKLRLIAGDKKMSPIVIQKILGHAKLYQAFKYFKIPTTSESFVNKVAEASEFNKIIEQYINKLLLNYLIIQGISQEERINNIIHYGNISDFTNPGLRADAFLRNHPQHIAEKFYLIKIYEKLDNLIRKLEENDEKFNEEPDLKKIIEEVLKVMEMNRFSDYLKLLDDKESANEYLLKYKKITEGVEIEAILVNTSSLQPRDQKMIYDEYRQNERARMFYSFNCKRYIVYIPDNMPLYFSGVSFGSDIKLYKRFKMNLKDLIRGSLNENGIIETNID